MNIPETVNGSQERRLDSRSREAVLRELESIEPNWRWVAAPVSPEGCSLNYRSQQLVSSAIISAQHSGGLLATARRNTFQIILYFVLAGRITISDRQGRNALTIDAGYVATAIQHAGMRLVFETSSSWLALQIPEPVLRRNYEELTGLPYLERFTILPTRISQRATAGLYETLRQAEQDLSTACPRHRPVLAKAYEQLMLAKLLGTMPNDRLQACGEANAVDLPRQLLRAEAFMRDNLSNPITVDHLADAAGCSPRALQRMFQEYRGSSPTSILCNYRLAAAHNAIRSGEITSIAELASSLLFFNPGRFSTLYKEAYGLRPSAALRLARHGRISDVV